MCRMLGVVSTQPRVFALLLEQAPHNMALLSEKHPDGWGIALSKAKALWSVHKSILRALDDPEFHQFATSALGEIVIVHVRQKTRGRIRLENTHPFEATPWVFTHNGTVGNVGNIDAYISPSRRVAIRGETDSERLFAFLLTRLDSVSNANGSMRAQVDRVLRDATQQLRSVPDLGTASFLLSDGEVLYAHRLGAPLYLLERSRTREHFCSECDHNPCIAVTTEPLTDEHWVPLQDGDLVRIAKHPTPTWIRL